LSIIHQLAISQKRRDEIPNKELAKRIVKKEDSKAIIELVDLLQHKDKNIQYDCIKVLYEIGERNPKLIAMYDKVFIDLLDNKNNRMIWGAMCALNCIAGINQKMIYANLIKILDTVEKGSVITRDLGVSILVKLAAVKQYTDDSLTLLLEQLNGAPTNQFPSYAESILTIITEGFKAKFIKILQLRLKEIEQESKRKRIEKILKKLHK
jgi:hypothetical protein